MLKLRLRQSAQVSARHRDVVSRAGAKEMANDPDQPSSKNTVT
jgi:hypothetical protein